jgi:hypothetical protein
MGSRTENRVRDNSGNCVMAKKITHVSINSGSHGSAVGQDSQVVRIAAGRREQSRTIAWLCGVSIASILAQVTTIQMHSGNSPGQIIVVPSTGVGAGQNAPVRPPPAPVRHTETRPVEEVPAQRPSASLIPPWQLSGLSGDHHGGNRSPHFFGDHHDPGWPGGADEPWYGNNAEHGGDGRRTGQHHG